MKLNNDVIDINLLKPHPLNKKIYGEEDIQELADKIRKSSFIKPLVISQENVIISGHRRHSACLLLQIKEVPYERVNFNNIDEELERLLLENEAREKTTYQKGQEAKLWEELEQKKANIRRISSQNNDMALAVREKSPTQEKGRVRDIIAEKVGIGSGKTYEKTKFVVNEIDKLKDAGNEKDAEFLVNVLNTSVSGAKDIIKSKSLDGISNELKDKVISKEINVKEAMKVIKKKSKNSKEDTIENVNHSDLSETSSITNVTTNISINEFQSSINKFIQQMNIYAEAEETLESIYKESKSEVLDSLENLENAINKIKDIIL